MKVHTDKLMMRIGGTFIGIEFCAIGLYAILGAPPEVTAYAVDRALWFGISAIVGGLFAIALSWLPRRIDNIWCAPPRRNWRR
jgi:hypothetical protein